MNHELLDGYGKLSEITFSVLPTHLLSSWSFWDQMVINLKHMESYLGQVSKVESISKYHLWSSDQNLLSQQTLC